MEGDGMDQKREHGDQQRGDHKPNLLAMQNLEADCKEYRKTQCVHPLTGYLKLNAIIGGLVFGYYIVIVLRVLVVACMVTTGKIFIALGIGTISMTSPIYISEVSPPKSRDTLVSSNYYLFAVGKFIFLCVDSYLTAFATSQDPIGSTDYIIALAGFPALLQFVLMLSLPDSPIWLYKRNREEDAIEALRRLYNFCEVEKEFDALRLSVTSETAGQDEKSYSENSYLFKIRTAWSSPLVRKQFVISNGLLVAQQLIGETAIIYCIPSIARMGGLASPNPDWDIWFTKFTYWIYCGLMALPGGIVGSYILVSRFGRRRLTPGGACLTAEPNGTSQACFAKTRIWLTQDSLTQECRMKAPAVATFFSSAGCHVSYSVVLGTIPWMINLKIYPAEVRGMYGEMAATTNWISFLSVIVLFLLLNKAIGSLFTIIFISLISVIVTQLIKMLIPENKGFFLSGEVGRKST
ncbi:probable inositol transporter 2 [Papaver somniferum]|uniref:probable inositol transporter 2 n=1 Tax=Papaver somniferum TaxID=3469 RepID=UPI000E7048F2|nr:probable inositol transporter 2 [Papaver somniferum]